MTKDGMRGDSLNELAGSFEHRAGNAGERPATRTAELPASTILMRFGWSSFARGTVFGICLFLVFHFLLRLFGAKW